MDFTGERVVPWAPGLQKWAWVAQHHAMRYAWAIGAVANKTVVDLGCGTGYGSFMLSWVARQVTGIDSSAEAVDFAQQHFQAPNLHYSTDDLATMILPPADIFVAFEVVEHLTDPQELFAKIVGPLLWSFPVNDPGQFHKHVASAQEIVATYPAHSYWSQLGDGTITPYHPELSSKYILGVRGVSG